MTNGEKYKTAKERVEAFSEFCKNCRMCNLRAEHLAAKNGNVCNFLWLDLEAEDEKPLLCPFCGSEVKIGEIDNERKEAVEFYIHCDGCHITTMDFATKEELISMWNGRASRKI